MMEADEKNNKNQMGRRRPAISKSVEREVLLEAGYRCAIPRCMVHTTETAHIIPWSESHVTLVKISLHFVLTIIQCMISKRKSIEKQ
jgi:hypothetical protein